MSSINTNTAAMTALQSLTQTQTEMTATQTQNLYRSTRLSGV